MAFTRQEWEKRTEQKYKLLSRLAGWLRGRAAPAGIVAYGSLATFTLWPLVEYVTAAAQAGQPLPVPVLTALGAIVGNLGSNVLAGQIQNWYQTAVTGQPPSERDVIYWLQQNVPQKADLREEVDTILEALQALPRAQNTMPAADWTILAQQLQAEMQRLGSQPRFQAYLTGSGLIIQGEGHKVASQGSAIIDGDVGGDLVMGPKTVQQIMDPAQMNPAQLRAAYLTRLLDDHNRLLLGGIDPKVATADNSPLALSAVYTALLTHSTEQKQDLLRLSPEKQDRPERLSALAQLNKQRHLVLLGDPGSGKSTFVNFVAVCLAGEALGHSQLNIALLTRPLPPDEEDERRRDRDETPQPQPWEHGALLPVCIVLRDFAARGLPEDQQTATARHLWDFIAAELAAASLQEYAPLLKKELLEKGGIFLFDGLDEVPTADRHRLHIKQVVEDVARTYHNCHILVTSRTYAYQNQDWRLPRFEETVLAPFSRGQIEQFIDRWYTHVQQVRHLNEKDAQGRAALLKQAVLTNRRLYDLAERPLLLTLMASLHAWRGGSLPENREELYADAVDLLLDVWERQRIVHNAAGQVDVIQPSLEQWLKIENRKEVRGLLDRLAYEAHASQPGLVGTADIAETTLVMGLLNLSDKQDVQPRQLVAFLSNRAGLLLPRGASIYTFPHRTFQEYLAACHLTRTGYPESVARSARTDPNRWREVALLAGAKAARGSAYALWGLVGELCHEEPGQGKTDAHWGAHLAGQFLVESADVSHLSAAQRQQVERVRNWLVHVLTEPVLPAIERAAAGRHLARLGDPRPAVTGVDAMSFCYVPPGDFVMGEKEEEHRQSCLDKSYWLARFPVTQAQYAAFVADGGYDDRQWWPEAADAGVWADGAYTAYGDRRTAPYDCGRSFQLSNLPVVGVSWYEALAFTKWLTARWQARGWLPAGMQVALPSEAEWEKAARGGRQIPGQPLCRPITDLAAADTAAVVLQDNPWPQRPYPWSADDLTPELANYSGGEIKQTSSVGCFAAAATVYGCEEMSGNVFEWTRSLRQSYPYDPADGREKLARGKMDWTTVRGGSWRADEAWQRCSARSHDGPYLDFDDYGFRVVLSPFSYSGR